jgi:hypothetical protein
MERFCADLTRSCALHINIGMWNRGIRRQDGGMLLMGPRYWMSNRGDMAAKVKKVALAAIQLMARA